MIAMIFTIESQASISPYCPAASRLMPPITTTMNRAITHCGTEGNQPTKNVAAPVTSRPDTIMSMTQYSQPIVKPAHRPIPASAYDEKEPVVGRDEASSASAIMTDTTMMAASA